MNGLPSPKGQMGQQRQCLKETLKEPTWSQNVAFWVHFNCPGIQQKGLCNDNGSQFKICELKERTTYHDLVAMSRKKWDISGMPKIPICDKCNKTVWVGGKKESTFVAYFQVNKLCYDQSKLGMCMMNGKTYWVGNNVKLNTASLNSGPIILDLLNENDERVCLRLEGTSCFSKNEEGIDPEKKIQKVAQALKRQESEVKRKRIEQERIRSLSEQYEQLERQYNDWGLPASSKNLFIKLMKEIATELGLSNCWICGGLKSAQKWSWKGESLAPEKFLKWDRQMIKTMSWPEGWTLDQKIIGTICISREGNKYTEIVGYTPCISTLVVNSNNKTEVWQPEPPAGYWSRKKEKECEWINEIEVCWNKLAGANPYQSLGNLKEFWEMPESAEMESPKWNLLDMWEKGL
ncbi:hypothetical protein DUI87_20590 [Hirundo rustica rustica]|uniref:Uncharacterized protein n=1 Tax=Hirundo rustica rustica TaxID=333673 RepID=A0A3M0JQX2_HIRRU|nr:hypothetical protein DUI87_20590 [Hirundo rustica rustica]